MSRRLGWVGHEKGFYERAAARGDVIKGMCETGMLQEQGSGNSVVCVFAPRIKCDRD